MSVITTTVLLDFFARLLASFHTIFMVKHGFKLLTLGLGWFTVCTATILTGRLMWL